MKMPNSSGTAHGRHSILQVLWMIATAFMTIKAL
jgi:hypothetical protein